MQYTFHEMHVTAVEARVLSLCNQFAPRDGEDNDLILMARALDLTLVQVRQAITDLQKVGFLQRVVNASGIPVVVSSQALAKQNSWLCRRS